MLSRGVSVIIPTYNRREFLLRAVKSVQLQKLPDWELIIVDDGSTDGTRHDWVHPEDSRIRFLKTEHRGVSAARNLGVVNARFQWISFLDSDDSWLPGKLTSQLEALENNPAYMAVHSEEIWIRNGYRVNPRKIHRKYGGWVYRYSLPRCIISPSSILLHRKLLQKCGGFDEDLLVCEDYELWLRIFSRYPIWFLEKPLVFKTGGHEDQLSRSMWGMDRFRVQALLKISESGNLTLQQKVWTASEIARKSKILAGGFAKRDKMEGASFYRNLAEIWGQRCLDLTLQLQF